MPVVSNSTTTSPPSALANATTSFCNFEPEIAASFLSKK